MSAESPHGFAVHQEEDKVAERWLVWIGVLVVVVSFISVGIAALLLGKDQERLGGGPAERAKTAGSVAPPTLGIIEQTLIEHEERGIDQRNAEEARLRTYGWVDRAHGIAHIPIEKAIDLLAADGGAP